MRAGRLNRRITIESKTVSQDSSGNITESWATFKTVWAAIEPLRGREYFDAKAINPETTVRFTVRHMTGLTEDMRIKDVDGNTFDIQSILHLWHRNREIQIMATQTSNE